jgi:hypothetical protein
MRTQAIAPRIDRFTFGDTSNAPGLITNTDFRDFVFTNPVRLWTANNTAVEKQASTILAAG